jgi:hypothetical protein
MNAAFNGWQEWLNSWSWSESYPRRRRAFLIFVQRRLDSVDRLAGRARRDPFLFSLGAVTIAPLVNSLAWLAVVLFLAVETCIRLALCVRYLFFVLVLRFVGDDADEDEVTE